MDFLLTKNDVFLVRFLFLSFLFVAYVALFYLFHAICCFWGFRMATEFTHFFNGNTAKIE